MAELRGYRPSTASSPNASRPRSQSLSSDRPSIGYGGLLSPPAATNPEPLYIAASAASQIVTNDHDSNSELWYDQHGIEPSGETALVAPGALKLVNKFLDQILFNFLSLSRSTSLASLRPAVSEVLKPKLAKDAIALADQELNEYLGGGEEEELIAFHNGLEPNGDWDLELVWKRTRLRCMVYSSLGDMEEEDEDHYTELEQLDGPPGSSNRFSSSSGVVSPAVAIFLTSILEVMGEKVLVVAGQAAYHRLRLRHERGEREGTTDHADIADRVVVEETDMEKVALDRTLGRLWRGWKKRIRSPTPSMSMGRSFSRESLVSRGHARFGSVNGDRFAPVHEAPRKLQVNSLMDELAVNIPLPMGDDDVREIEVPGVAYQSDDEELSDDEEPMSMRPKSMFIAGKLGQLMPPGPSETRAAPFIPSFGRPRSSSLPVPPVPAFDSSLTPARIDEIDIADTEHSNNKAEGEDKKAASEGSVTRTIAGAAALSTAAIGGFVAAAIGRAPTKLETAEEESDGEEALIEEPKIMTASRASVHGRVSPDETPGISRSLSIRTQSIHSVRIVEVSSPNSPGLSRHNSVNSSNGAHPPSMARSASAENQQRGTSPVSRVSSNSPIVRQSSSLSQRKARSPGTVSIPEHGEQHPNPLRSAPILGAAIPERSPLRETSISVPSTASSSPRNASGRRPNQTTAAMADSRDIPVIGKTPEPASTSLTSLRESTEINRDSSDEASTIVPSTREQRRPSQASSQERVRATPSQKRTDGATSPKMEVSRPVARHKPSSSSASSASTKLKPIRTSEDTMPVPHDDKGKAFEQLLQNDRTIQFTLTPENMREMESPESPRMPQPQVYTKGADRPRKGSNASGFTAIQSTPTTPVSPKHRSGQRPVANSGAKVRAGVGQARDARVDRDSINDFADFIRSTGPPNVNLPPKSSPTASGHRGQNGTARSVSATMPLSEASNGAPRRSQSSATRLQAREAVVPATTNSSDLIDFIRQGPPSENSHANPRIPRTVAPFRTTLDSDQMTGALGAELTKPTNEEPRVSQTSTDDSKNDASMRSIQSSMNSQSALLGSHNRKMPQSTPAPAYGGFDDMDMMPKRKTRRVRDPYAIDFSDEEDDEFYSAPAKPVKPVSQEESLIDFLNSVPPPPAPAAPQPFDLSKPVSKKTSSHSLIGRFSRNSITHGKGSDGAKTWAPPSRAGLTSSHSAHAPVASKPNAHPNPVTKLTKSSVNTSTYASRLDSERKPATRVQQITYQPREPVSNRPSPRYPTSDLADFLKNTPPPPSNAPRRLAVDDDDGREGGFTRMFQRTKKAFAT